MPISSNSPSSSIVTHQRAGEDEELPQAGNLGARAGPRRSRRQMGSVNYGRQNQLRKWIKRTALEGWPCSDPLAAFSDSGAPHFHATSSNVRRASGQVCCDGFNKTSSRSFRIRPRSQAPGLCLFWRLGWLLRYEARRPVFVESQAIRREPGRSRLSRDRFALFAPSSGVNPKVDSPRAAISGPSRRPREGHGCGICRTDEILARSPRTTRNHTRAPAGLLQLSARFGPSHVPRMTVL